MTDDLVSEPLDESQARTKCEEAADMIVAKHAPGGHWRWLDHRHLRVYTVRGDAFLTLKIEALQ